jgi:UDP-N-acetylmuramoyl-tripeptide--D-alanyl-D-alanine ligase
MSKPTIGLVTNIGYGHLEMVGSREGIARAKGELLEELPRNGTAVLWSEDDYLDVLREIADGREVRTFGTSEGADCRITDYRVSDWSSAEVQGICNGEEWTAHLPAAGRHIALNAAAAVLAAACAGVEPAQAAEQLRHASLPPMRMEVRDINGAVVLLDTYNASPPAMISAIETLRELPVQGRRVAVLGDMRELGEYTPELHAQIGAALTGLDSVLLFGPNMTQYALSEAQAAGLSNVTAASSISDVRRFLEELQPGDAALLKGSRALELERALERKAA